jgi:hypothetical protein
VKQGRRKPVEVIKYYTNNIIPAFPETLKNDCKGVDFFLLPFYVTFPEDRDVMMMHVLDFTGLQGKAIFLFSLSDY